MTFPGLEQLARAAELLESCPDKVQKTQSGASSASGKKHGTVFHKLMVDWLDYSKRNVSVCDKIQEFSRKRSIRSFIAKESSESTCRLAASEKDIASALDSELTALQESLYNFRSKYRSIFLTPRPSIRKAADEDESDRDVRSKTGRKKALKAVIEASKPLARAKRVKRVKNGPKEQIEIEELNDTRVVVTTEVFKDESDEEFKQEHSQTPHTPISDKIQPESLPNQSPAEQSPPESQMSPANVTTQEKVTGNPEPEGEQELPTDSQPSPSAENHTTTAATSAVSLLGAPAAVPRIAAPPALPVPLPAPAPAPVLALALAPSPSLSYTPPAAAGAHQGATSVKPETARTYFKPLAPVPEKSRMVTILPQTSGSTDFGSQSAGIYPNHLSAGQLSGAKEIFLMNAAGQPVPHLVIPRDPRLGPGGPMIIVPKSAIQTGTPTNAMGGFGASQPPIFPSPVSMKRGHQPAAMQGVSPWRGERSIVPKTQITSSVKATVIKKPAQHSSKRLKADDLEIKGDPWRWRKYGQKPIQADGIVRCYYKCSDRGPNGEPCFAKRQVDRAVGDNSYLDAIYEGLHNHAGPPMTTTIVYEQPEGGGEQAGALVRQE